MSKKKKKAQEAEETLEERPEYVEPEKVKIVVDTVLEESKAVAVKDREHVYEPGYYGKDLGERVELALVEALLLLKRGRIRVFRDGREMMFQELFEHSTLFD